jgi:hypothetical protein
LEDWREAVRQDTLMKISGDTLSSFQKLDDAALWFTRKQNRLKRKFQIKFGSNSAAIPDLQFSNLTFLTTGTCDNISRYSVMANRAIAIPTTIDFVPHWGNFASGHSWVAIVDDEGPLPFNLPIYLDTLGRYKREENVVPKIYRETFSFNKQSHVFKRGYCDFLPGCFNNAHIIDVTNHYLETFNVDIPKTFKVTKTKFAYVAVADKKRWIPVGWGDMKKSKANFKDLTANCVYLPMSVTKNGMQAINRPFVISENGDIRYIKADRTNLQTVILERKYPMRAHIARYIDHMIKGQFQFADNSDFKNPTKVYTIDKSPGVYYNEIPVRIKKKYRFVRYLGRNWSDCHVAEIAFYEKNNEEPLKGEVLSSPWNTGSNGPDKAFDGNDLTFVHIWQIEEPWVGLDLGKPKQISKIRFVSRNDKNHIVPGNFYELFYWDNQWISLGRQTATSYKLVFESVPSDCLFLLQNHTEGKEERIFTYENGEQVWW